MPEISEFDHEFMTAGSQSAEGEKLAGLVQQNLTPEEQTRLEEIMPIIEEFNTLILKAQTGEFPEEAGEMGLTNGQGVPEQGMMEGRVPQDMQNQQRPPLQAVEGQMPQNAPEMMSGGGKVDRFDPEGKGYDIIMAEKAGLKPKTAKNYGDVQNVGHMLSSARLADLVNNNVLAKEDLEKYNLPIDGYLLLKGMKHDTVDKEIREIFTKMNGGNAWLELENEDDIFNSGINYFIQFQNKPKRESTSISGGEKTLAAVVFVLGLQKLKPSPFYLFDEIDAHLDAPNAESLSKIVEERSHGSQFIMVSLKDSVVEKAKLIYGVYPKNGVSNIVIYKDKRMPTMTS